MGIVTFSFAASSCIAMTLGVLRRRAGERKQRFVFLAAEIFAREQFGRQDQLRAARGGLFDQRGDGSDIGGPRQARRAEAEGRQR